MYNIASCKVGNKDFVKYYNSHMKGFSYRIQNLLDSAIYVPTACVVPFPYNLSLMVPGIDYIKDGDLYYAYYEHVGEAYTVIGLGYQNLNLNFGGPLNFTIPVAFPHGPDGYKNMLIEARRSEGLSWYTLGSYLNLNYEMQKQGFVSLDEKITEIQKELQKLQEPQEAQEPQQQQRSQPS